MRTVCERRKSRIGDDALEDRHLVNLMGPVDQLEELLPPWLTLPSQQGPTLSRRTNVVEGVSPTLWIGPRQLSAVNSSPRSSKSVAIYGAV